MRLRRTSVTHCSRTPGNLSVPRLMTSGQTHLWLRITLHWTGSTFSVWNMMLSGTSRKRTRSTLCTVKISDTYSKFHQWIIQFNTDNGPYCTYCLVRDPQNFVESWNLFPLPYVLFWIRQKVQQSFFVYYQSIIISLLSMFIINRENES
jgi:hypothetical protein